MGLVRLLTDLERLGLWHPHRRGIVSIEAATSSTRVTNEHFLAAAGRARWSVEDLIRVPVSTTDWAAVAARVPTGRTRGRDGHPLLDQEVAAFQREFVATDFPPWSTACTGRRSTVPDRARRRGGRGDLVATTGTYNDALGRRFRGQYTARFGRPPGWSQAGAAYDQVNLLAAAWSATATRGTEDVIRYLRRWPHRGVNGVYYFGEHKHRRCRTRTRRPTRRWARPT